MSEHPCARLTLLRHTRVGDKGASASRSKQPGPFSSIAEPVLLTNTMSCFVCPVAASCLVFPPPFSSRHENKRPCLFTWLEPNRVVLHLGEKTVDKGGALLGGGSWARFFFFWLYDILLTGVAAMLTAYFSPGVEGSGIPVSFFSGCSLSLIFFFFFPVPLSMAAVSRRF